MPGDAHRRLLLLALIAVTAWAERLPVKVYTTADGLARNRVQDIMSDSRGFIWIATSEGLSLFDGYRFVNYGARDGLPSRVVHRIIEARDGAYWVATNEGLCVLHPRNPGKLFTLYHRPSQEYLHGVYAVVQDRSGAIWAGTDVGLYRESQTGSPTGGRPEWIALGSAREGELAEMRTILEDRRGALWIGGGPGLYRRLPDGRVEAYSTSNGLPTTFVERLVEDGQGRIWAGTRMGLCLLVADPHPGQNIVERIYTEADGLGSKDIKALTLAPDGSLWSGALAGGLSQLRMGSDGRAQIRTYDKTQGLSDEVIIALAFDRAGNLWVGGESAGLMRIVRNGFLTYTPVDGLPGERYTQIFETSNGEPCVVGGDHVPPRAYISCFNGRNFDSHPYPEMVNWPAFPLLQDHLGRWWVGAAQLLRFGRTSVEQLVHARPEETFRNSVPSGAGIYRMFEDSLGSLWMSLAGPGNGVLRWDAVGLQHLPRTNGPVEQLVSAFAEDHAGNIWMGLYGSGVVRYRDGIFTTFLPKDGIPDGAIQRLYVDGAGRLWIATTDGGVGRIDRPEADRPTVRIYDAAHGLSSDSINSIVDDQWGRIYLGTGRGLDRLDPSTGLIKHYTIADGLANDQPFLSLRDHRNWLWFGTTRGLSRLIPESDPPRPPPPIRITSLSTADKPYPISQLGETSLAGLQFPSGDVRIEFASIDLEAGEVLQYQYRLDDNSPWSAPSDQRSVTLGLSPGSYRFQARAMDSRGQLSEQPASIAFRIPPPLWGRLWFRLLALAAGSFLLYAVYRFRLERALELEHIRTRIATDLHDDIGSSLSQIAILSEVARRPGEADADALDPLGRIAAISRELVDSMSDIVWAVNPKRDNLRDLTRRMRQFAGEMLVPGGIEFTFDAESAGSQVALGADLRRQVFLIFKECLNNAARHSGATQVDIAFELSGGWLRLNIRDNGRGFDTAHVSGGHGLASMSSRAAVLHGTLKIESTPGAGTTARLAIPLGRRRW